MKRTNVGSAKYREQSGTAHSSLWLSDASDASTSVTERDADVCSCLSAGDGGGGTASIPTDNDNHRTRTRLFLGQRNLPNELPSTSSDVNEDGSCRSEQRSLFSVTSRAVASIGGGRNDKKVAGNAEETTDPLSPQIILARDMNNLSLKDRESVYEEIHGVHQRPPENPEEIERAIQKMERAMKKMPNNSAYMKALFVSPKYCKSLYILFLRAENMNPKPAAKRCVFHFEKKMQIFGDNDCLGRPIVWNDLDDDALRSLRHGYFHYYPTYNDRIGRTIGFSVCSRIWPDAEALHHTKAAWYAMMSCIQRNEEVQRRGICSVLYFPGSTTQHFYRFLKMYTSGLWATQALPFRISVVHVCLEHDGGNALGSILSSMLRQTTQHIRIRTRIHHGSHLESQYALGSFGISSSAGQPLPIDRDGNVRWDVQEQRLREMKEYDDRSPEQQLQEFVARYGADIAPSIRINARGVDVLLGRGQPFQRHPGTVAMMKMVEEMLPEHERSDFNSKKGIAKEIIRRVKEEQGGSFMQRFDGDLWIVVSDTKAHEKVAMGFRNLSRMTRRVC